MISDVHVETNELSQIKYKFKSSYFTECLINKLLFKNK